METTFNLLINAPWMSNYVDVLKLISYIYSICTQLEIRILSHTSLSSLKPIESPTIV